MQSLCKGGGGSSVITRPACSLPEHEPLQRMTVHMCTHDVQILWIIKQ